MSSTASRQSVSIGVPNQPFSLHIFKACFKAHSSAFNGDAAPMKPQNPSIHKPWSFLATPPMLA
ncbi:hypothetical protein LguiA_025385 [Lonicera macranthoides]